jgi:2-keto-3-deoxy-galactonokinase
MKSLSKYRQPEKQQVMTMTTVHTGETHKLEKQQVITRKSDNKTGFFLNAKKSLKRYIQKS